MFQNATKTSENEQETYQIYIFSVIQKSKYNNFWVIRYNVTLTLALTVQYLYFSVKFSSLWPQYLKMVIYLDLKIYAMAKLQIIYLASRKRIGLKKIMIIDGQTPFRFERFGV